MHLKTENKQLFYEKVGFLKLFLDLKLKQQNLSHNEYNKITSYAEVVDEVDIESQEKINALSQFHIWSESYIKERMNWMPEKPIKAVFLKVYKVPEIKIPIRSEYHW